MKKKKRVFVIVGRHGLYSGSNFSRLTCIAEFLHDAVYARDGKTLISRFVAGRCLDEEQRHAWDQRMKCGDRCIPATITF